MDGSLGSTTALFFDPYVDAPNTSGLMVDEENRSGNSVANLANL
jgi:predicted amidohydrolase YtcJ